MMMCVLMVLMDIESDIIGLNTDHRLHVKRSIDIRVKADKNVKIGAGYSVYILQHLIHLRITIVCEYEWYIWAPDRAGCLNRRT